MTEAEWLAGDSAWRMPDAVVEHASDRKLRLAGCAVCRWLWDLLIDTRSRKAIETAEQYADGRASAIELAAARRGAATAADKIAEDGAEAVYHAAVAAKYLTAPDGQHPEGPAEGLGWAIDAGSHAEREGMAAVLQCVFGNPFRPLAAEQRWLSATVVALAQAINADRAFDRVPILADALEDAGCTDAAILDHCRQPGEHVHGCWVVDLVLGRS